MRNLQVSKDIVISQFVKPSVLKAMKTLLEKDDLKTIISASCEIATLFGSLKEFSALVEGSPKDIQTAETKLITSFYNNLNLLVQKTWVEAGDEALKDQVLTRIDTICTEAKKNSYTGSYLSFISILHDVVYLMFGNQAKKDDFAEYALRIDPGFGTFWWYVESMPQENSWSSDKIRIVMLLGMFFLANY